MYFFIAEFPAFNNEVLYFLNWILTKINQNGGTQKSLVPTQRSWSLWKSWLRFTIIEGQGIKQEFGFSYNTSEVLFYKLFFNWVSAIDPHINLQEWNTSSIFWIDFYNKFNEKLNTKPSDLLELDRFNKIYQVTIYKLKFLRSQAIFNK